MTICCNGIKSNQLTFQSRNGNVRSANTFSRSQKTKEIKYEFVKLGEHVNLCEHYVTHITQRIFCSPFLNKIF